MKRKFTHFFVLLAVTALFFACSNDNPKPIPDGDTHKLNKGFALHEGKAEGGGQNLFTLQLTNRAGSNVNAFTGDGESISLKLVTNVSTETKQLPSGTYQFTKGTPNDLSILNSNKSSFEVVKSGGPEISALITGGSITVSSTGSTYTIKGNLTGEGATKFDFEYTGAIAFSTTEIPDGAITFSSTQLSHTSNVVENVEKYRLNLTNQVTGGPGETLTLNLLATTPVQLHMLQSGTYTVKGESSEEANTILGDGVSKLNTHPASGPDLNEVIVSGEIEIAVVDNIYTITGELNTDRRVVTVQYVGEIEYVGEYTTVEFTNIDIHYFSHGAEKKTFEYIVKLWTDDYNVEMKEGTLVSLRLVAKPISIYNGIAEAQYEYNVSNALKNVLHKSPDSYLDILRESNISINAGVVTIKRDENSEDFIIDGAVGGEGTPMVQLKYKGALDIKKATVNLYAGDIFFKGDYGFEHVPGYVLGTPLPDTYLLEVANIETNIIPGGDAIYANGPGESLIILISGPQYRGSWNDPVPAGKYLYKGDVVQDYTIQCFGGETAMKFVDENNNSKSHWAEGMWTEGDVTVTSKEEGGKTLYSLEGRLLLADGIDVNFIMTDVHLNLAFQGNNTHKSYLTKDIVAKPLTKILGYKDFGRTQFTEAPTFERVLVLGTDGMVLNEREYDNLWDTYYVEGSENDDAVMIWLFTLSPGGEFLLPGNYMADTHNLWGIPFTFSIYDRYVGAYKNGTASNFGPLVQGGIEISKEGEIYTIKVDMYDDARYPHNVKATYVGEIPTIPLNSPLSKTKSSNLQQHRSKHLPEWLR